MWKKVREVVMNEEKTLSLYETHIKDNFHIYGLASILYGILYVFCMFKNDAGISYLLFAAGTIGYFVFVFTKLEMKMKKESWFYIISILILGVSTFCTDDGRIIFFNKLGVFLLTISMVLGIVYDTKKWNLGKYLGSILRVSVSSMGEIAKPFSDLVWFCKNKLGQKHSKYLYVLIGFGISIPVVAVVFTLLTSADAVFRNVANQMFAKVSVGDWFLMMLMFSFMALLSYCLVANVSKKEIKEEVNEVKQWDSLIAIPVSLILSLLYLYFSVIQIVYLFMGNMQLPVGYTYAEYAREGFFQLLAVSIMNLVLVLMGLYYFKSSKVLKCILSVMSLCTFIMIASSGMRMIIYIQYYYLTFLRVLVLFSLVVLAIIFLGVLAYIMKDSFPLFRYCLVVVTCLYIVFSFSHPDYWIAKVNLEGAKESRSEFFKGAAYEDYYLLEVLSADAASVMLEWIVEEGYGLEIYYEKGMTFEDYLALNEIVIPEEKETEEEIMRYQKCVCVYTYLTNLSDDCLEQSFRKFNLSRFVADTEVLFQITKGM